MTSQTHAETDVPLRLVNTGQLKSEIAEKLTIGDVAEKLCDVDLYPAGHQQKGLCPIHGEDSPSFFTNDGKGFFHCFGCKAGGDSIDLVRAVHHVDYTTALMKLAAEAGIDISAYQRPPTPEEKDKDEIRRWMARWFAGLKPNTSRVDAGRNALIPARPNDRPAFFKDKDYLFRGEVLFPYHNAAGHPIGWKVRDRDKKMFAVPYDFPLWEHHVYGLHEARKHVEDGRLLVVEGEYDREALVVAGLPATVAVGGSRWTDEQMEILEDLKIREVVFLFDGDEGGRTGAESVAKRFWQHPTIRVRVKLCPEGADPEDLVNSLGADWVRDIQATAPGALEWLLRQEWESRSRRPLTDKLEYVKWVQDEYGERLNGVQEGLVLQEVARWLEVPEANVLDFARAKKTMLQAPDSEKVVLGKAIREINYLKTARKNIRTEDFFVIKHQRLWSTLESLMAEGHDSDLPMIKRYAEAQGVSPEYVELLAEAGDVNIGWHEEQVIDFAVRRSARTDADDFRDRIADLSTPANQLIGSLTHAVTQKALGRAATAQRQLSDQVDKAVEVMHERMKDPDSVVGITLGSQFPSLTQNLQGLQPRRLVLVAATSGRGKSTMTLQWCANIAIGQAVPTDFVSLEMDDDEVLFKMASHLTDIDSLKIMGGRLTPQEAIKVEQAMVKIRKSPLRIYCPDGITPNEFLLYAREARMDRRTEVFVIDYAQMVGPDPEHQKMSRYDQLGEFAYLCKQKIARGLDTTVIACAQLKREAAEKEEPTPEDMGDSYQLVRAADVILLIHETESSHETWIGKNRQGPGQIAIPCVYTKPVNTFREVGNGAKIPDYAVL